MRARCPVPGKTALNALGTLHSPPCAREVPGFHGWAPGLSDERCRWHAVVVVKARAASCEWSRPDARGLNPRTNGPPRSRGQVWHVTPYAAATHRLEFRGSHPTLQDRQVLMNAAAAAEVALAEFVYVKLGSVSERAGERVIRNASGIVGLLQPAEDLDGPVAASRRNRISARVSGPRNDAAHRGSHLRRAGWRMLRQRCGVSWTDTHLRPRPTEPEPRRHRRLDALSVGGELHPGGAM